MSEDNHQMCSGIRAARKIKQSKTPQRGLGVEKLEKIRLEEQRKNGGVGTGGSVMPLPPPLPPPIQQYQPPPPVPFPAASLSDFTSPPPPMPSSALVNMANNSKLYASRVTNSASSGSLSSLGWSLGSSGGFSSAMLSSDSTMKVETDSKPNWPPLGVMQWRQQNQIPFSSFMNPPLSSSSSSSGMNFQTEPPSNQNTYHSYNQSSYMNPYVHHDEHKIAGMKRSWPFGLDNLPDSFASTYGRSNDSYGKRNPALREGLWGSASNHLNWHLKCSELNPIKRSKENASLDGEFRNPNKRSKGNGNLDGNFLSLGISANPMYSSTTKYNQPTTTFPFPPPDYHEISNTDMLSFQRSLENQVIQQQQQHSLFSSKEQNTRHSTSTSSKVELGDGVDLTLRL